MLFLWARHMVRTSGPSFSLEDQCQGSRPHSSICPAPPHSGKHHDTAICSQAPPRQRRPASRLLADRSVHLCSAGGQSLREESGKRSDAFATVPCQKVFIPVIHWAIPGIPHRGTSTIIWRIQPTCGSPEWDLLSFRSCVYGFRPHFFTQVRTLCDGSCTLLPLPSVFLSVQGQPSSREVQSHCTMQCFLYDYSLISTVCWFLQIVKRIYVSKQVKQHVFVIKNS